MLILPPFTQGEVATLRAPRSYACTVTDPDGESFVIDNPYSKRTDIALTKVGTWRYEWPDGTTGELVVVDAEPASVVVP